MGLPFDQPILFHSLGSLLRIAIVGIGAYVGLVVMLRASGKRTLSKMNAFDFIVTVALGSTLAAVLLDRDVPLADGLAALALLVWLQYAITWASVRSARVRALVKSEPTLLVHDGAYLEEAMRRQRVTREEILGSLRQHGHTDLARIACVVLESDGSLSVVARPG